MTGTVLITVGTPEPLIIAVKRKAALGARDKGTNTRAAVGTDKAAKSGGEFDIWSRFFEGTDTSCT